MEAAAESDASVLYEQARLWIKDEASLTPSNVAGFAVHLARAAQRVVTERGRGEYKKTLVLSTVRVVIENDVEWESDEQREAVAWVVEHTLPSVLDVAVSLATGDIDLEKGARRFAERCLPCFVGRKRN